MSNVHPSQTRHPTTPHHPPPSPSASPPPPIHQAPTNLPLHIHRITSALTSITGCLCDSTHISGYMTQTRKRAENMVWPVGLTVCLSEGRSAMLLTIAIGYLCVPILSTHGSTLSVSVCTIYPDVTYHGLFVDCRNKKLTDIPQEFPTNTTSIDLGNNQIDVVANYSFSTVDKLKVLDLRNNNIKRLEPYAFEQCGKLRSLTLIGNDNKIFHNEDVLDGLTNLVHLSIESDYPERIFKHLQKLQHIEISLHAEPLFTGFQYLIQLRSITLLGISQFKNDTFVKLAGLTIRVLNLHCTIAGLEINTFLPLTHLKELSMVHTSSGVRKSLASLHGLVGRNMTTIEITNVKYLSGFQSESGVLDFIIRQQDLKYLVDISVKKLLLSNNNILFIDLNFLLKSNIKTCLTHMDLSLNSIVYTMFSTLFILPSCAHLQYIDCSNQNLHHTKSHQLGQYLSETVNKFTVLLNNDNASNSLSNDGLKFPLPPLLETLNMSRLTDSMDDLDTEITFSRNRLSVWDCSYNGIVYIAKLHGLKNLKMMDLSGNPELTLDNSFFNEFPSLEVLKLDESFNQSALNEKGELFLKSLPNLLSLHIAGNRLMYLQPHLFDANPRLEYVDLSRNLLTSVPTEFLLTSCLHSLDMSYNSIVSLDRVSQTQLDTCFKRSNKSDQLDLTGNYISCSCTNIQFLSWLKETDAFGDKSKNFSCVSMLSSVTNTGTINNHYLKFWRFCTSQKLFLVSITILVMLFCSILLTLLISTNYTKLTNILINIWQYQISKPKRVDFKRDAYVSYAEADYQWVCHELCPALEERNLTLYIWDRDSVPGDSIPDQIVENVSQCWKIIIYLTDNYETDPWSYMSMMAAINCVDNLNPGRLLLLLPEEVPLVPDCLLAVVPESCIIHVDSNIEKNAPFWDEICRLIRQQH